MRTQSESIALILYSVIYEDYRFLSNLRELLYRPHIRRRHTLAFNCLDPIWRL